MTAKIILGRISSCITAVSYGATSYGSATIQQESNDMRQKRKELGSRAPGDEKLPTSLSTNNESGCCMLAKKKAIAPGRHYLQKRGSSQMARREAIDQLRRRRRKKCSCDDLRDRESRVRQIKVVVAFTFVCYRQEILVVVLQSTPPKTSSISAVPPRWLNFTHRFLDW
jgi:hypothetical protein